MVKGSEPLILAIQRNYGFWILDTVHSGLTIHTSVYYLFVLYCT